MKLSSRKQYKQAKGPQLGRVVLSSALPVVSMTFHEVGAPACLSGWPLAAANISAVHTLLMAIQSTFLYRARGASKKI